MSFIYHINEYTINVLRNADLKRKKEICNSSKLTEEFI